MCSPRSASLSHQLTRADLGGTALSASALDSNHTRPAPAAGRGGWRPASGGHRIQRRVMLPEQWAPR